MYKYAFSPDQRHWNIPLDPVDPGPRRHQCQDRGHQIDQLVRRVGLIPPGLPEFVESGSPDDESGVNLEAICSESRVFKELLKNRDNYLF